METAKLVQQLIYTNKKKPLEAPYWPFVRNSKRNCSQDRTNCHRSGSEQIVPILTLRFSIYLTGLTRCEVVRLDALYDTESTPIYVLYEPMHGI